MLITRETDYAVRCILALSGTPHALRMAQDIAKERMIPGSFALKILQKLVRAGFVESSRGVKGGFRLSVPTGQISLFDVIKAIQGDVPVNTCAVDRMQCSMSNRCSVHPVWVVLRKDIVKKLGSISFQKLLKDEMSYEKNKTLRRRV